MKKLFCILFFGIVLAGAFFIQSALAATVSIPQQAVILWYETGFADTVYTNQTYIYRPRFIFKNQSVHDVQGFHLSSASGFKTGSLKAFCNGQPLASINDKCTLKPYQQATWNGTYVVEGEFPTIIRTGEYPYVLNFAADNGSLQLPQIDSSVFAVPYVADHVAFRIVDKRQHQQDVPLYIAARGSNSVTFASNGVGSLASGVFNISQYQCELKTNGQCAVNTGDSHIVYLPKGVTVAYISSGKFIGFGPGVAPNVTGQPTPPPYVLYEFDYPVSSHPQLYTDLSYVNFFQLAARMNMMGNHPEINSVDNKNLYNANIAYGLRDTSHSTQSIMANVKNSLNSLTGGWNNMVAHPNIIFSPIAMPAQSQNYKGLDSGYYTNYAQKLWTYLAKNPLYVNPEMGGSSCLLEGQVKNGLLIFNVVAGHDCSTSPKAPTPGGTGWPKYVTDIPPIAFTQFNDCDIIQAAGSYLCHPPLPKLYKDYQGLWGPNGTYRSVIGRDIVSLIAVGLLPNTQGVGASAQNPLDTNSLLRLKTKGLYFMENYRNVPGFNTLAKNKPVGNAYSEHMSQYVDNYTYTYGDFLGMSGTTAYLPNNPSAAYDVIQPVTAYVY